MSTDLNIDNEMEMKKLQEELLVKFNEFRKTIEYMAADAPISVLCLDSSIEKALISHGCLRVYDLFNCDFTKIKGIRETGVQRLTTSLNQFLSML